MQIVLATRNQHKKQELVALLGGMDITIRTLDDFPDAPDVVEDGETCEANAMKKAVEIARYTGLPAVADDTGLEVDALGEIEHLPIADAVADVVISNCVINLSPDKPQVFREAFRVLKAGGRLAISDVVAIAPLPEDMRNDAALVTGCMGNASLIADLEAMMRAAGFEQIRIQPKDESKTFIEDWAPGRKVTDFVVSATIEAIKPGTTPSHLS